MNLFFRLATRVSIPCKVCGRERTGYRISVKGVSEFLCWKCLVWARTGQIPPDVR